MTRRAHLDGELLTALTPTEHHAYLGPRGATPAVGTVVTLWRLPGVWAVWSPGPTVGTWWLKGVNAEAAQITQRLLSDMSQGTPVVHQVWHECIAVRSRDIRPGGGAEMSTKLERITRPQVTVTGPNQPHGLYSASCGHCPWTYGPSVKTHVSQMAVTHRDAHRAGREQVTR